MAAEKGKKPMVGFQSKWSALNTYTYVQHKIDSASYTFTYICTHIFVCVYAHTSIYVTIKNGEVRNLRGEHERS